MQTVAVKTRKHHNASQPCSKTLVLNGHSAIQLFTCYQCKEDSIYLEENVLIFVIEGALNICCGKEAYEVSKNKMAYIRKHMLLNLQVVVLPYSDSSIKAQYILLSLKHDLVKEFVKLAELCVTANEESLPVAVDDIDKQLLTYIESLHLYFREPQKVESNLVKIKLLELLFYLPRLHEKILEQLLDLREDYRINITSTVEENVMTSISLHQLAVLSGRSLSSFRRDFLAIYNMPPSQWIRQKKLDKAKELLTSTTMSITDICYTTGFENIAHFSRLFKNQFKYPPSEFRTRIIDSK